MKMRKAIAKIFNDYCKKHNLSASEFSKVADIKLETIERILRGEDDYVLAMTFFMLNHIKIDMDDFFGEVTFKPDF